MELQSLCVILSLLAGVVLDKLLGDPNRKAARSSSAKPWNGGVPSNVVNSMSLLTNIRTECTNWYNIRMKDTLLLHRQK